MANIIVGGIIVLAVGAAVAYIVKAKKSGTKCIGCPSGGSCPHCNGGCDSKTKQRVHFFT